MGQPVVVGVDGSPSSVDAVRWAAREAGLRETVLRLVQSYEVPAGFRPGFVNVGALEEALAEQSRDWLAEARRVAEGVTPGLDVETVSLLAGPVAALVRESTGAAATVLGSRGLGGFTGMMLGSTAVALAARAHSPVVVVRENGDPGGPVVVGVDGTPTGEAAIAFAFAEASMRGTGLIAVHTWTELLLEVAYPQGAEGLNMSPLAQEAEAVLGERLAGWQEKYPDVVVARHVGRDRPAAALLRHAEDAQLVVVGSRGRGGFRGLLLGSTSQHLLQHAPCPVAVVRTGQD